MEDITKFPICHPSNFLHFCGQMSAAVPKSKGGWRDTFMNKNGLIAGGVIYDLPIDLAAALKSNPQALAAWEDLTPIARNEWICWIETAKKAETRIKRVSWGCDSLQDGKRRPCCWPGCSHRQRLRASAR